MTEETSSQHFAPQNTSGAYSETHYAHQLVVPQSLVNACKLAAGGAMVSGIALQILDWSFLPGKISSLSFFAGNLLMAWGFFSLVISFKLSGIRGGAIAWALSILLLAKTTYGSDSGLENILQYLLRTSGLVFIFVNLWPLQKVLSPRLVRAVVISQLLLLATRTFSVFPDTAQQVFESLSLGLVAWLFYAIINLNSDGNLVAEVPQVSDKPEPKPEKKAPNFNFRPSGKFLAIITVLIFIAGGGTYFLTRDKGGNQQEAEDFARRFTIQLMEATYGDEGSEPTYKLKNWEYEDGYYILNIDTKWTGGCCNFIHYVKCPVEFNITTEIERTGRVRSKTINKKNDCAMEHEVAGMAFESLGKIYELYPSRK